MLELKKYYCTYCGELLNVDIVPLHRYSLDEGKQYYHIRYRCPKYNILRRRHSTWLLHDSRWAQPTADSYMYFLDSISNWQLSDIKCKILE